MQRSRQDGSFYAAALLIVIGVVYVVAVSFGEAGPGRPATIALALVVAGAALALAGWFRARRDTDALVAAERAAKEEAQRRLDSERERLEEELDSERKRIEEKTEAKQDEVEKLQSERRRQDDVTKRIRDWNRTLRERLTEVHHERGPLGDPSDVPALVLQLAMTLLESEKGLLLSRQDAGSDGELDLLASHGFDNDPQHSDIAQRFAREVIERDTTLREDDAPSGSKPADKEINCLVAIPIYVQDEFSGVVVCANRDGGFEEFDDEVLLALGDHTGAILHNARLRGDLRNSYVATVRLIADALEAKDPFLRSHSDEVSGYVAAVADRLGMDPREKEELVFGSLLHDFGKIGISERILLKPASLTPEERSIIELHPRIGYRLVQQVPALQNIAPAILHHHERWDGAGYPQGLRGEQIPLAARIVCIADSFSAMTTERPYRSGMTVEEALAELERCAGEQFDPEVVRIFSEEVRKRPPVEPEPGDLAVALADAELEVRQADEEPLLGYSSYAVTDNLTLLYSHRYFHEMGKAEAQRAALQSVPFSIVMVELTDIERRNLEEGYAAGDEALKTVAGAVQRAGARCRGFACRYSGRRLALIAPRADERAASRLASEIIEEVGDGAEIRTRVAEWRPGEDIHDLVGRLRGDVAPADGSRATSATSVTP